MSNRQAAARAYAREMRRAEFRQRMAIDAELERYDLARDDERLLAGSRMVDALQAADDVYTQAKLDASREFRAAMREAKA